ncbi:hypothetical protein LY78DRAFT_435508 [Colletotrichum sublineola]|nr:hypothetical protein LY78DRAFT_435508 [Colletotrichum sublineola]
MRKPAHCLARFVFPWPAVWSIDAKEATVPSLESDLCMKLRKMIHMSPCLPQTQHNTCGIYPSHTCSRAFVPSKPLIGFYFSSTHTQPNGSKLGPLFQKHHDHKHTISNFHPTSLSSRYLKPSRDEARLNPISHDGRTNNPPLSHQHSFRIPKRGPLWRQRRGTIHARPESDDLEESSCLAISYLISVLSLSCLSPHPSLYSRC